MVLAVGESVERSKDLPPTEADPLGDKHPWCARNATIPRVARAFDWSRLSTALDVRLDSQTHPLPESSRSSRVPRARQGSATDSGWWFFFPSVQVVVTVILRISYRNEALLSTRARFEQEILLWCFLRLVVNSTTPAPSSWKTIRVSCFNFGAFSLSNRFYCVELEFFYFISLGREFAVTVFKFFSDCQRYNWRAAGE